MGNELTVVNTISAVCEAAATMSMSIRGGGIIRKAQRDELRTRIEAARIACENEQTEYLFEQNLDLLEKANNRLEAKQFTGKTLAVAQSYLDTLAKKLGDNLEDFCRKHPGR